MAICTAASLASILKRVYSKDDYVVPYQRALSKFYDALEGEVKPLMRRNVGKNKWVLLGKCWDVWEVRVVKNKQAIQKQTRGFKTEFEAQMYFAALVSKLRKGKK